jgi:hypothetical protein
MTGPLPKFPQAQPGFSRETVQVHHKYLIRSLCDYCGLAIVANLKDAVREDEGVHREYCRGPKEPAARPPAA